MKTWGDYVKTKGPQSQAGGAPPTAKEYFLIKAADNWHILLILALIFFFFIFGASYKEGSGAYAPVFFDAGKICLGLLLGLLKKEGIK